MITSPTVIFKIYKSGSLSGHKIFYAIYKNYETAVKKTMLLNKVSSEANYETMRVAPRDNTDETRSINTSFEIQGLQLPSNSIYFINDLDE
jgi:hypothetical protein